MTREELLNEILSLAMPEAPAEELNKIIEEAGFVLVKKGDTFTAEEVVAHENLAKLAARRHCAEIAIRYGRENSKHFSTSNTLKTAQGIAQAIEAEEDG